MSSFGLNWIQVCGTYNWQCKLKRVMKIQIRNTCNFLSPILQHMIALSHFHFVTGCPKKNSKIVKKQTKTKTHNWWGLVEMAYIGLQIGLLGRMFKVNLKGMMVVNKHVFLAATQAWDTFGSNCGVLIGYTPRMWKNSCRVGLNYHTITCIHYMLSRLHMYTFHQTL